jgi:hypothetical protein
MISKRGVSHREIGTGPSFRRISPTWTPYGATTLPMAAMRSSGCSSGRFSCVTSMIHRPSFCSGEPTETVFCRRSR